MVIIKAAIKYFDGSVFETNNVNDLAKELKAIQHPETVEAFGIDSKALHVKDNLEIGEQIRKINGW
jgi:hypothetical protein